MSSRSQSVPSLEPSRGLLRTKSPEPAKTHPGVRVRSPSPPRVRGAVKVPERFKSLVPPIQAPAQHFRSPDPRRTSTISPEPVLNGNSKPNGSVNVSAVNGNSANGGARQPDLDNDDPSLTRKKVVKVVCQVVRKALPAEEEDAPAPEPTKPAPEPPKFAIASANICAQGPKGTTVLFQARYHQDGGEGRYISRDGQPHGPREDQEPPSHTHG